jgi:hypothetical protein
MYSDVACGLFGNVLIQLHTGKCGAIWDKNALSYWHGMHYKIAYLTETEDEEVVATDKHCRLSQFVNITLQILNPDGHGIRLCDQVQGHKGAHDASNLFMTERKNVGIALPRPG